MPKHRDDAAADDHALDAGGVSVGEVDDVFQEGEAQGHDDTQLDRVGDTLDLVVSKEAGDEMLGVFFQGSQDKGRPDESWWEVKRSQCPEGNIQDEHDQEDDTDGSEVERFGEQGLESIADGFFGKEGVKNRKTSDQQHKQHSQANKSEQDLHDAQGNTLIDEEIAEVFGAEFGEVVFIDPLVDKQRDDRKDPDKEGIAGDVLRESLAVLEAKQEVPKHDARKGVNGELQKLSESDVEYGHSLWAKSPYYSRF